MLDGAAIDRALKRETTSQKRVFFSGRLIKEKRIDKWLAAFRSVTKREHGVKGVLIGEGVEHDHIESMIRGLGLEGKVQIRKFYNSKADLYKMMAGSAVFLHMSEREGLGIIALESLALGTPVVLPDYSPIPEDVKRMCVVVKETRFPPR